MKIDVKCVCGRVHEITPLIPTGDDGVYVPFDLAHKIEEFKDGGVNSIWRADFGSSYNSVTCECGKAINGEVKIRLEKKQDPLGDLAIQRFLIDNPGGKQVHATQNVSGDWKEDTYLYQEDDSFYFERYCSNHQHDILFLHKNELKEHVAKLVPLLFTAEQLKQVLAPTTPSNTERRSENGN